MQLFIDDKEMIKGLEKCASEVILPDDVSNWPEVILEHLYKQAPFLAEYDVELDLSRMDKETRTAFGFALISAKSVEPRDRAETRINKKTPTTTKKVRIPIIIQDGNLKSMDIFMHAGKPQLLTARRIRIALFKPEPFDIIAEDSDADSGIGRHVSRSRALHGLGPGGVASMPYKLASAIKDNLTPAHFTNWDNVMEKDHHLKEAALSNTAVLEALDTLTGSVSNKVASVDDIISQIPPTSMQFWYDKGTDSYALKTASHNYYQPSVTFLGRGEAIELLGPDMIKKADLEGPQTMPLEEAEPMAPPEEYGEVSEPGMYRLRTATGDEVDGYVFTDVRNFDNSPATYKVMTNGEAGAMQETMFGKLLSADADPPEADLDGFGAFYGIHEGHYVCYPPCNVVHKTMFSEGYLVRVEPFGLGEQIDILISEGVTKPVYTGERYLIPSTYSWVKIGKMVPLAETPEMAEKRGSTADYYGTVKIINSGGNFSFEGPAVEKLGSAAIGQNLQNAEFIAATLGHDKNYFHKIADVESDIPVSGILTNCHKIEMGEELKKFARTVSLAQWDEMKGLDLYPVDLLKEAVFLEDPTTVDAALSLNFLSPENLAVFATYKDSLDNASKKLAELLLATRLGMKNVEEGPILTILKNLERVIVGLKKLDRE